VSGLDELRSMDAAPSGGTSPDSIGVAGEKGDPPRPEIEIGENKNHRAVAHGDTMQTCQHCETKFTPRIGAKAQVYCSASCRRAVQNIRARADEQHTQVPGLTLGTRRSGQPESTLSCPSRSGQ
jgi:hypothetical protein